MYLVHTPFWLRMFFPPGLIWNRSRTEPVIYLTFDDGPIPIVTPWVLETLKNFNARATFFCIGDNISKHPDIFEQVKAGGHSIGNHTYNHLRGWNTSDEDYIANTAKCNELTQSKLFRPPYGRARRSQFASLNMQYDIIMWDVLSGDFDQKLSPEKCLKNVIRHTRNGSVIVFHDSLKAFDRLEYTLPRALEHWKKNGFSFGIL